MFLAEYTLKMTPRMIKNLPLALASFLISIIPYTPLNLLIFCVILTVISLTNLFYLAQEANYSCKFNKLQTEYSRNIWTIIKNSYYIYLYIAFVLNFQILISE